MPLRLLTCLLLAIPMAATAAIEVDTTSTTPGGQVTVIGSGFDSCASNDDPSRTVEVYATGPSTDLPAPVEVEPDPTGGFSAKLTVPATASPGRYTVGAWCAHGTHDGPGITTQLTVTAPTVPTDPTEELHLSPDSVAPGGEVTASGGGFVRCSAAGARVAVRLGNTTLAETGVEQSGTFTVTVPIPVDTPAGVTDVEAVCTDTEAGDFAATRLTVTPAPVTTAPVTTAPVITAPTTTGPVTGVPDPDTSGTSRPGTPRSEEPGPAGFLVVLGVVAALVGATVPRRRARPGPDRPGEHGEPAVITVTAGPPTLGPAKLRDGSGPAVSIRVLARCEGGTTRVRGRGGEWSE